MQHNLDNSATNNSVQGFSIKWTGTPNPMGTKPPHPQFQSAPVPANMSVMKNLPNPTQSHGSMPVGLIQSNRQPFAVEHAYTKYGELNTGLGTNIGS